MIIVARYAATCADCNQPINVGDRIMWARKRPVSHAACPAPVTLRTPMVFDDVAHNDTHALESAEAYTIQADALIAEAAAQKAAREAAAVPAGAVNILAMAPAPTAKTYTTPGVCARIDQAFTRDSFVATSCACCGKMLTDPNSIETGMGPICRRDHGFDVQDAPVKWAACFAAMGQAFPVDTYESIVERHDHYIHKTDDDTARDVKRAVKLLVHRIAVAEQANIDGATVLRCVLAIQALGYCKLARVLARAMVRRPVLRDLRGALSVFAISYRGPDTLYIQSTLGSWCLSYAFRRLGIEYQDVRGGYTVNAKHLAAMVTLAQNKGADITVLPDAINVSRDMSEPTPVYTAWTDDGVRDTWLNLETSDMVRFALPGEPMARPGWEKVPSAYFGHGGANGEELAS